MSGSSVPEAARAAALVERHTFEAGYGGGKCEMPRHPPRCSCGIDMTGNEYVRHIVAAASVELQQEVDRLSAECEALRGTVAEERATTGRRIEEFARVMEPVLADMVNGAYFGPIADVVVKFHALRAALASPGEGELSGRRTKASHEEQIIQWPGLSVRERLGAASPGEGE